MAERLPRKFERVIAVAVIGAAAFAGCSIDKSKGYADGTPRHLVVTKVAPKPTTVTTAAKPLTRSELTAPLYPRGGNYNAASTAVLLAEQGDVTSANNEMTKVTAPIIKSIAEDAIQLAYATEVANDAQENNIQEASQLLPHITTPDISALAVEAYNYDLAEVAEYDVFKNHNYSAAKTLETKMTYSSLVSAVQSSMKQERSGNEALVTAGWFSLYNMATTLSSSLSSRAYNEWDSLYLHSDAYWQQYEQAPQN